MAYGLWLAAHLPDEKLSMSGLTGIGLMAERDGETPLEKHVGEKAARRRRALVGQTLGRSTERALLAEAQMQEAEASSADA
jgi:hypothetical protein